MRVLLQPLRIPTGWVVAFNLFYEIDPDSAYLSDDDRHIFFSQDLLQFDNPSRNRLLDLGWYPHANLVDGKYGLVVHDGDFRGRLLYEFRSRDRLAIVAEIERLLDAVSQGKL